MPKIIKSEAAKQDLSEIWEYIAEDSPVNASQFLRLINQKCLLLVDQPHMGVLRTDIASRLRSFPVGHYVIFYRPINSGIELVRILHAGRDFDVLF